jgi:LPPG:FO 2-phospho-L-lactate transferase
MTVAVICGGVGAARLLTGVRRVVPASEIVAVANVGDDLELHGLHVSPDLDTIVYTTAGAVSPERGWGLEGETWQAMEMVSRYGGVDWFNLGDRDLGTHLYRTHRLRQGATLAQATSEIVAAWGLDFTLLPVTNDRLRTMVTTVDEGEITFQEYFVRRHHEVAVTSVRFDGSEICQPAPGVMAALEEAERIVIAPSNPAVSIDPVLAVPGVRQVLSQRRQDVVAISPIVGGRALKGPADRLMQELGVAATAEGVARWYAPIAGTLVMDLVDEHHRGAVEALGLRAVVMPTVMSDPAVTDDLARVTCRAALMP